MRYIRYLLLLFSVFLLCSCSENKTDSNNLTAGTMQVESNQTAEAASQPETYLDDIDDKPIENLENEIAKVLNKGESGLFWCIGKTELPDMDKSVNLYELEVFNRESVKNSLLNHIFSDWKISEDQEGAEEQIITAVDMEKNEAKLLLSEDGSFSITFKADTEDEVKKQVLENLISCCEKVSGVRCMETEYIMEDDEPLCRKFLFYPDGIVYDLEGRGDYEEERWISGSGIYVDEMGDIWGNSMPVFKKTADTIHLSDYLSAEEIRLLCETAWEEKGYPAAAVAENMDLIYIVGKENDSIIPAWQISGYYYVYDQAEKHIMHMIIDAETGKIIRYS